VQQRGYAIRFFDVAFLVRALPIAIGRGAEKKWLLDWCSKGDMRFAFLMLLFWFEPSR
jgi:hypothetical protein